MLTVLMIKSMGLIRIMFQDTIYIRASRLQRSLTNT